MSLDVKAPVEEAVEPEALAEPAAAVRMQEEADQRELPLNLVMAAALCSSGAAGWMLGGVFRGLPPKLVCLGAACLGVAWTWGAFRTSRVLIGQVLLIPIALAAGAVSALPGGNGLTIPDAVNAALQNGGLLQPPVPFDPGWRFLAVPLVTLLAGATGNLAGSGFRPRLSLMLPLPLVVAAALVQDPSQELLSGGVALVLIAGSLMLLANAEIRGDAQVSRGFQVRRTLRGAGAIAAAMVVLGVANQAGFLFPQPVKSRAGQPQKPAIVSLSAIKDRPLFVAQTSSKGPWRLGVLDVYQDNAFYLPAYDPSRLRNLPSSGKVQAYRGPTESVTFTFRQAPGHDLPVFGEPVGIQVSSGTVSYDPLTQTARVVEFVPPDGFQVTVKSEVPPSGQQLEQVSATPAASPDDLYVPPPPPNVQALLSQAPKNPWERLQYVRTKYYDKVVASGSGAPVDVPPSKVASMLAGGTGTPYEITAGEVMLARWAGIPARLAFGYYGGRQVKGGWEIHPQDGANWLEVYFKGHGWVPVFGVPPQARSTLTNQSHNRNVVLRPTQDINVQAFIPIALDNPLFLYQVVQYWILVCAGPVLLLVLLAIFFPWPLKLLRGRRRRRWARGRDLESRIAVEYAELRDLATDLNAPGRWDTALEFLDRVEPDAEHAELAWLVTRALWGDLRRDLRPEDAEAAASLGASVRRRLARAQPLTTRVIALASRASLREPYDEGLPNLWRRARPTPPARLVRRTALAVASVLLLGGCGTTTLAMTSDGFAIPPVRLPAHTVPANLGGYDVTEEVKAETAYRNAGPRALVSDGRMYSLHSGGSVKGLLQVEIFKPQLSTLDLKLRRGVRDNIGNGNFKYYRLQGTWIGEQDQPDQVIFLWFPEQLDILEVLTVRSDVAEPQQLVKALLQYQGLAR